MTTSDGWTEAGDHCWVRRYDEWDVNVGVVAGSDALLVIDTRGTLAQGRQLLDDVRRLSPAPPRFVANTHLHFDHTFGNKAFADAGSVLHAHENAVAGMLERGEWIKEQAGAGELDGVTDEQTLRRRGHFRARRIRDEVVDARVVQVGHVRVAAARQQRADDQREIRELRHMPGPRSEVHGQNPALTVSQKLRLRGYGATSMFRCTGWLPKFETSGSMPV